MGVHGSPGQIFPSGEVLSGKPSKSRARVQTPSNIPHPVVGRSRVRSGAYSIVRGIDTHLKIYVCDTEVGSDGVRPMKSY